MTLPRIEIDPDVRRARTPPPDTYRDPAWFEEQVERVHARAWHWIGDEGLVPSPGSVAPAEVRAGALAEPLLLARDERGEVSCLSNVCTHRGNLLVEAPAHATTIRCGYHGRCFGLDGRVVAAPGFEGAEGFPSERDALPRVPLGRWRGHLFASPTPVAPFEAWIAAAWDVLSWFPFEDARPDPAAGRLHDVAAHWALYVENYLEGFHVPYVHAGLARVLDLDAYETVPLPWGALQVGYAKDDEPAFEPPIAPPGATRRAAAYWLWLFPTTMLNVYPWGLSINVVTPLAPDRTRVTFHSYVLDARRREGGAGGDLDRVEAEDEAVVLSVERGVRARLYRGGRYAPAHEAGVHRFHRLLAACWNGDPLPPPASPAAPQGPRT